MIDYENFKKSLKNLEAQHDNWRNLDASYPEFVKEGMAESVIQRFETCYDAMSKVLRRYLEEELGLSDVPTSPRRIFRLAGENDLLSSPVEQWMQYVQARTDTTHRYDSEKAVDALGLVSGFIDDAIGLYQTMSEESWE